MPERPETSVVILTKNAGPEFRQTLTQIFRQQTQNSFEVIVVDSGSTDQTLEIADDFPVRKFTIPPHEFNFGLTRDYAFSLAAGDYLITLSQDAIPENDQWLQNLIRPFASNPNLMAVQGMQRLPTDRPSFYWDRRNRFYFTSETTKWLEKHNKVGLAFVNCAVRRAFWATHPIGFTPMSSDKKFQTLIQAAGGEATFAEDAVCIHGHNYTFRSLVRTIYLQGVGRKYAGMEYSFRDCVQDIVRNRGMLREGLAAARRGEIKTWYELFYLFLRPPCIYWGNRTQVRGFSKKTSGA